LLNSFKQKSCTEKCDQRSRQEHEKIDNVKRDACVVHVYEPERTAKMGEREKFGDISDCFRQLLERRKSA